MQILIFSIITALISSYLTYYFAIKSKRHQVIIKFKEEKYSHLLVLLQGFVGGTASGETKRKFFEQYYQSWLYCSDGVAKAINDMVKFLMNSRGKELDQKKGKIIVGNIVLEMRKDMLGKTKLKSEDFMYIDIVK